MTDQVRATEYEPRPTFAITEMSADAIDGATAMRLESWVATYVNEDLGVTEEWIRDRFASRLSPETHDTRVSRFETAKQAGKLNAWVARDAGGEIVGSTTPFITEDGKQRVGSIYVDKKAHGTGLGSQLMQKVVDWFDPEKPIYLEVVTYNERAKAFYRKWGFEEIPGTEDIYADLLPEVTMIRQPENSQNKGEA